MIRILLVDDQPVVRSSLQTLFMIFDDLELVGEAADGEAAVQLCGEVQPDVVLMDVLMPRMNGVTATRLIRECYPHIQVVILTSFSEAYQVQSALDAGAIGYLLKNVSAEVLADAIRAAHLGSATLSPEAVEVLDKEPPHPVQEQAHHPQTIPQLLITP